MKEERAAVGLPGLQTGLVEQKACDHAMHHLLRRRHQLRLCDATDLPMLMTSAWLPQRRPRHCLERWPIVEVSS